MNKKNKTRQVVFRLNILFLIIFLLFSSLILRLGFVQIVHGEEFRLETERNSVRKVSVEAPRGWMVDRNGEILVYNTPVYTVTYTESTGKKQDKDKEKIAEYLSKLIDMEEERILKEMNRGMLFAPQSIKQNLTVEEMFRVSEHLDELPGVDIIVDPIREYPYDRLFRRFIGSVGDIQAENVGYYLAKGYRMNERVGTSYLEEQYEEQLRGTESIIEVNVDKYQRAIGEPELTPGQRGNDLVLTIDHQLQNKIEEVISKEMEENPMATEAFFVAMDPFTGEILGMSNDVRSIGSGRTSYAAGSTVKMATLLMGLHEGIVTPNQTITDRRIRIGNIEKGSWKNLGSVNAFSAIQRSSNVYMFNIGLKLANYAGGNGYYRKAAFDDAFYYFSQFGLGIKTGIDLPGEFDGYKSNDRRLGLLADFMIGQYHNYTPLQLAQYVSTIANGGYRMQPYLVKEVRRDITSEGDMGQLIMQKEPTILNKVDMSEEHLDLVRKGMEMVTAQGGTASSFANFPVKMAAKTGTAQTEERGKNNTSFVGYAPADNPQIAFACIVPKSQTSQSQGASSAQKISREILEAYFTNQYGDEDQLVKSVEE